MAQTDPTGKAAPSGGFKDLGWYSGYQWYQGSFAPQAGAIHPQSPQVGAGQAVSKEVIAQTSPANVAYIQSQQQQAPKSQEEVTPYLNNFQSDLFKAASGPEVRVPTMEELKTELAPETPYPSPLDRVGRFEELRTTYKVSDLEKQLTDLKAQEDELYAQFREQKFTEEGKPVPLNVIEGRISEEERTYLERVDYLGRQVSRITDELNTKYNLISTYMNLENLDYQDAVKRYETEFDQNLQMYNIILGQQKEARSAYEADRAAASANLQMYYNAVTSGNIDYGSLSADQKIMINKLEAQSGLPVGFMSSVKKDADADVLFTTSNEGITQVGIRNADGTISVQSYGTRISSTKQTEAEYNRKAQGEMSEFLSGQANSYGHVDPNTYNYARKQWISEGLDPDSFDSIYRTYRDPNRTDNAYNVEEY